MNKQYNIPKLRFPEFPGEWERKNGDEIFSSISNKNHSSNLPILAITQEFGAIPRNEIDFNISVSEKSIETYKVVNIGDFIISLRSFQGGIEYSDYEGICSPAYIILKPIVPIAHIFFKHYFKTNRYIKILTKNLEGIRDGKMISFKYFSEAKVILPSLPEQTKIASFLTEVDKKLTQLKEKKALHEKYKKGVMQKIFAQQLRFKDDDGNEFPEWEEKNLGNIGETYTGLSGKSKESFGQGKPYIQYKQIFDDSKIDMKRCGLVEIKSNDNQNEVRFGDIFFTTSSETPNEVGFSSVLLEEVREVYLNSFCFGFRIKSFNTLIPEFAQFLFRNSLFRKTIYKLSQGSTRYNISKTELMKTKIFVPIIPEQTKIANFLTAIDDKIESVSKQIKGMGEWKKGLMQKMFC